MLELKNISKDYGNFALDNITFKVEEGDYFMLLGPSGAGKTQILEIIAGLEQQDSGQILLNNKDISTHKIQKRAVGLVFQDHALFPHLSVFNNIAYPVKSLKKGKAEIREKVNGLARQMEITHLLDRKPDTLSGGENQRLALARTLASDPKVLLLDEPLASLDVQLKSEIRRLVKILNNLGQTIIHVTHDFEEAVYLASQVAVISNGKIIQTGSPGEVFYNPTSEFVAHFTGTKNYFKAKLVTANNQSRAMINEIISFHLLTSEGDNEGYAIIRSDEIFLSKEKVITSATNNFKGNILEIYPSNNGYEVIVDIGIKLFVLVTKTSIDSLRLGPGKDIWVNFKAASVKFVNA